jgi:guanine deaminase
MLAGKVLMDRNAPAPLLDTAQRGYDESRALIARWHGRGRQRYVVTPRFAVTSTEAQLQAAGALIAETPDVYVQSHMNENRDEIALALRLYPGAASYADIYRRYGILGPRTILGHCIHMTEAECQLLADTGTVAAFCPTSNLFLGSGLLDRHNLREARRPVRLAYATDVGGGTSYSMLATLAEAYKVSQLQGQKLPAAQGFHCITRGNAEALGLAHEIGSLEPGRAADLVVLDTRATPAMRQRMAAVAPDRLDEELFVLMIMGDDRAVRATYVQGERVTLDG